MGNAMFTDLLRFCREKWRQGWSKEYREMDEKKFIDTVYLYMSHWMLLKKEANKRDSFTGNWQTDRILSRRFCGKTVIRFSDFLNESF